MLHQYTWAEVQARGLIEINLLLLGLTEDSRCSSSGNADGESPGDDSGSDSGDEDGTQSETNGVSLSGTNEESPNEVRHYTTIVDFQRACYLR